MSSESLHTLKSKNSLNFPGDLFYNILYHIKDLTWLWTDCREVSSAFKKAVELVFITKHLRKTWLLIDGGMMYSEKYGKVLLSCNFEFSHLDPDPLIGRVTFTEKECADIFKKKLISRLKSIFEYGNLAHDPKVIVQVRKDANDTQIPGMEADWDKLEISFDWKKMYSAYFREDKEYHRRLGAWVDTQKDAMLNIREQVDKGELDQLESFKRVFTMFGDSYQETRKQVRRSRIRREVWENDEVDWELSNDELFDDDDALKKLKDTRFAIGLGESFSDESDGGGENAEEGANSEVEGEDEDDWEDMDEDGEDEEVEDGEDELVDGEAGIQY